MPLQLFPLVVILPTQQRPRYPPLQPTMVIRFTMLKALFAVAYTVENPSTLLNGADMQRATIHENRQITSLMNVFGMITITDIPNTVHHHRHWARNIKNHLYMTLNYIHVNFFHLVHVCSSSSTSQEACFVEGGNVMRRFCIVMSPSIYGRAEHMF